MVIDDLKLIMSKISWRFHIKTVVGLFRNQTELSQALIIMKPRTTRSYENSLHGPLGMLNSSMDLRVQICVDFVYIKYAVFSYYKTCRPRWPSIKSLEDTKKLEIGMTISLQHENMFLLYCDLVGSPNCNPSKTRYFSAREKDENSWNQYYKTFSFLWKS